MIEVAHQGRFGIKEKIKKQYKCFSRAVPLRLYGEGVDDERDGVVLVQGGEQPSAVGVGRIGVRVARTGQPADLLLRDQNPEAIALEKERKKDIKCRKRFAPKTTSSMASESISLWHSCRGNCHYHRSS